MPGPGSRPTGPACMYMPSLHIGSSAQQLRHGFDRQPSRSIVIAVGSVSMSTLKIMGGGSDAESLNSTKSECCGAQQTRARQWERSFAKKMCCHPPIREQTHTDTPDHSSMLARVGKLLSANELRTRPDMPS